MIRTKLTKAGLAALLVLGSLTAAGALPASASESPGSAAASPGPASASPGMLKAMQRDLGLSRTEAEQLLDVERRATAAEPKARKAAGSTYGGSWLDEDSGKLTVALTPEADASTVRKVRSAGATVRTVEHSARQLDATMSRINRLNAPQGVSDWFVDPAANTVTVNVVRDKQTDNDVRRFIRQARKTGPVTVHTVSEQMRTTAAGIVGGDMYTSGSAYCSIGFAVHGGFVTAGHCGGVGVTATGWDGSYIGTVQGSSTAGDDYAWVSAGNGWWTTPVVLGWGTVSDQLVRGSAEAPVGASVCRSGRTTHWQCGYVLAKNQTVRYVDGTVVYGLTETSACAGPGDSGGPLLSGDQAQGVLSGAGGNCGTSNTVTSFQPVNEILNRYGLTLETA